MKITNHPKRLLQVALMMLLLLARLSTSKAQNKELKLKVGDVLHYKMQHNLLLDGVDQDYITHWVKLEVTEKNDSSYWIIGSFERIQEGNQDNFEDSRNGYTSNAGALMYSTKIPFQISKKGEHLTQTIPDSTAYRIAKQETSNKFDLNGLQKYLKEEGPILVQFLNQFIINLSKINNGKTETGNKTGKFEIEYQQLTKNKQDVDIRLKKKSSFSSPMYLARIYNCFSYSVDSLQMNGVCKIDKSNGLITSLKSTTTTIINDFSVGYQDKPIKIETSIQKVFPDNDQIRITANLSEGIDSIPLKCFAYLKYIDFDIFELDTTLQKEKTMQLQTSLKRPIALRLETNKLNHSESPSNFLIEPGDQIHLLVSNQQIAYSGKGSLKNTLLRNMQTSPIEVSLDRPVEEVMQKTKEWQNHQFRLLESHRDSLSAWAFQHLKCEIYYRANNCLMDYYNPKHYEHGAKNLFHKLFKDILWDKYNCISSLEYRDFVNIYLLRKYDEVKSMEWTRSFVISNEEKFYLAKMLFKHQTAYVPLSQIIYNTIDSYDFSAAKLLLNDYEKFYNGTEFYQTLNRRLEERSRLDYGHTIPNFSFTDITGRTKNISDYKGKYVLLLFIDVQYGHQTTAYENYLKMKSELPNNQFELITVFVNKNDSLNNQYIQSQPKKGVVVKNPDWQLDQMKLFRNPRQDAIFLISPDQKIITPNIGFGDSEFNADVLIEMITKVTKNEENAAFNQRTLYWVLAVSGVLIMLGVLLIILIPRRIKKREAAQREQLELRLKAVRSQLNPHFLFNAMSSIQYLVNHQHIEKANLFLSKFAGLMRKILFQSEVEMIPLHDEIETIKTYLELEALRHSFLYQINIDESIDLYNTEIPVMLLQPFVENAVIHGVSYLSDKGIIQIDIKKQSEHTVIVRIIDNGKGLNGKANSHTQSNGKGIGLTQKRIELMMAKYKQHIDFKMLDRKQLNSSETGTQVEITFETEQ